MFSLFNSKQHCGGLLLRSQYNMEMAPCAQAVMAHAASLLECLNFQREQTQFCDCVLRQRQSPGQLYPAHKCVLAASSPVLASILSSAGALVELQAPCLSDSVLTPLLDYVYTGALPYTYSLQQYHSLLSAACYLQMDELQEALKARQHTELNAADIAAASTGAENQPDINNTHRTTVRTFDDLSSTSTADALRRHEETNASSVQSPTSSLETVAHQYSANVETFDETHMHLARIDSSIKGAETSRDYSQNCANHCRRTDVRTSNNSSTSYSALENSKNAGDCRQVNHLTLQDYIQNIPTTAKVINMSKVNKEVQKHQFHSAAFVQLKLFQKTTELVRTTEGRRSSSLSPHPCCGAVPVICHSSRATTLQLPEVSAVPPNHPASQASVISSQTPVSSSASTDNDSIVESVTTKHKSQYGAPNQDYRVNKSPTVPQSLDYKDHSNQCAMQDICYMSSAERSDMMKQEYNCCSTDHFITQNDEHMDNELSVITEPHNQHGDSFQSNTKLLHLRADSVPRIKDWRKGFRDKTDHGFDDFPSKQKRLDCLDSSNVSPETARGEHSQDLRAVVPLPVEDSDTGSDCKDLCPEGEVKEEHSYRCPAEMDTQDSRCNLHGPQYPNMYRAEMSINDAASIQHEHDANNRSTAMENKEYSIDLCLPVSTTPGSSLDNITISVCPSECHMSPQPEKISGTEITEPRLAFTVPVDSNMSNIPYSVVGPSYRGHLHYHCVSQADTHTSHGGFDDKHSQPSLSDHSDESNNEEDVGTFPCPGHNPLKQHFATENTEQVLLLDISTKPAALLVSCKHRSDTEEKGTGKKDAFDTRIKNHDTARRNDATSVAGSEMKTIRVRDKFGAEGFDEAETESSVGQTNVEEIKSVGKELSRPGAEVIQTAGAVEVVSNPKEGDNRTGTWTLCPTPGLADSVQVSMSPTLSGCIPSTLSGSVPMSISAYLSAPGHHSFQCSLCNRSFSQRGSLNRHVRSHLGVRPFPCPRCPMTFSRQYRVTEHMRVHQRNVLGNDFQKPPASSV
ncbi:uncharacterized protein [Brachyistius frenatus]|uniref:uncharacterized protein isoform X1 n=2 Tax=Brachyistius frenatus TaxID=100188 RepID=UPI0037E993BF